MGGSHCIYARLKDTERYVLVSEVPHGSMDSFKHHVVAYTMDRKHQNKKSLYLYKGYLRLAKAIVRGKYLEITFNSTEAASGWDISEEKLDEIRNEVAKHMVEGDLRREVNMNVKRLMDLGCFRGLRHRRGLPLRGQRTKTNARTRKGPRKPIKR